jgi:methyltransferase-like protein
MAADAGLVATFTSKEFLVALLNVIAAAFAFWATYAARKASEATPDKALIKAVTEERASSERQLKEVLQSQRNTQRALERQLNILVDLIDRKF